MVHKLSAAVAIAASVAGFVSGTPAVRGYTASVGHAASAHASQPRSGPLEQGRIVGWRGGDAVIYPTVGFFGAPQIFAVGGVRPDGSFEVRFPATLPVDLLEQSSEQCPTFHSSDPAARTNFTGNYLLFQHGVPVGATHSGSSLAFASFSGFANGDTRTGFLYADRDTTLRGFCQRTLTFGGSSVAFLQRFDLPVHTGWNMVVATLFVPQAGHVVADLTVGSNRASEQWYFFRPPSQG